MFLIIYPTMGKEQITCFISIYLLSIGCLWYPFDTLPPPFFSSPLFSFSSSCSFYHPYKQQGFRLEYAYLPFLETLLWWVWIWIQFYLHSFLVFFSLASPNLNFHLYWNARSTIINHDMITLVQNIEAYSVPTAGE